MTENLEQRMDRLRREQTQREQREREERARKESEYRVLDNQIEQDRIRRQAEAFNEVVELIKSIGARRLLEEVRDNVWRTGDLTEYGSGVTRPLEYAPRSQFRGLGLTCEHPSLVIDRSAGLGEGYPSDKYTTHPHLGIRIHGISIDVRDSGMSVNERNPFYVVVLLQKDTVIDPEHPGNRYSIDELRNYGGSSKSLFQENANSFGVANRLGDAVARYCMERNWPIYLRNEAEEEKRAIKKSPDISFWIKRKL